MSSPRSTSELHANAFEHEHYAADDGSREEQKSPFRRPARGLTLNSSSASLLDQEDTPNQDSGTFLLTQGKEGRLPTSSSTIKLKDGYAQLPENADAESSESEEDSDDEKDNHTASVIEIKPHGFTPVEPLRFTEDKGLQSDQSSQSIDSEAEHPDLSSPLPGQSIVRVHTKTPKGTTRLLTVTGEFEETVVSPNGSVHIRRAPSRPSSRQPSRHASPRSGAAISTKGFPEFTDPSENDTFSRITVHPILTNTPSTQLQNLADLENGESERIITILSDQPLSLKGKPHGYGAIKEDDDEEDEYIVLPPPSCPKRGWSHFVTFLAMMIVFLSATPTAANTFTGGVFLAWYFQHTTARPKSIGQIIDDFETMHWNALTHLGWGLSSSAGAASLFANYIANEDFAIEFKQKVKDFMRFMADLCQGKIKWTSTTILQLYFAIFASIGSAVGSGYISRDSFTSFSNHDLRDWSNGTSIATGSPVTFISRAVASKTSISDAKFIKNREEITIATLFTTLEKNAHDLAKKKLRLFIEELDSKSLPIAEHHGAIGQVEINNNIQTITNSARTVLQEFGYKVPANLQQIVEESYSDITKTFDESTQAKIGNAKLAFLILCRTVHVCLILGGGVAGLIIFTDKLATIIPRMFEDNTYKAIAWDIFRYFLASIFSLASGLLYGSSVLNLPAKFMTTWQNSGAWDRGKVLGYTLINLLAGLSMFVVGLKSQDADPNLKVFSLGFPLLAYLSAYSINLGAALGSIAKEQEKEAKITSTTHMNRLLAHEKRDERKEVIKLEKAALELRKVRMDILGQKKPINQSNVTTSYNALLSVFPSAPPKATKEGQAPSLPWYRRFCGSSGE